MSLKRLIVYIALSNSCGASALNGCASELIQDAISLDSFDEKSSACMLQVGSGVAAGSKSTKKASHTKADPLQSISEGITDAADSVVDSAVGAAGAVKTASAAVVMGDFKLNGASKESINRSVLLVCGIMAATMFLGFLAEWLRPHPQTPNHRPSYFVQATIVGSYLLLIPGLFCSLFDFLVGAELMGMKFIISQVDGHPGGRSESTVGFIRLLWNSGGLLGALLVSIYAIIVPAVKLGLLVAAEMMRASEDPAQVKTARKRISAVQLISKWACPDMFAYILLLYLFRDLSARSSVFSAPCQLEVGFTCFSIFCVFSTVGALALQSPDTDEEETPPVEPLLVKHMGTKHIAGVVGSMLVAFSVLLYFGMVLPAMGMRLDQDLLFEPKGTLPAMVKPAVQIMDLAGQVNTDVSLWKCISALVTYFDHGEANCIIAFVMLAVFMLFFAILDMVLLFVASVRIQFGAGKAAGARTLRVTKWLKHCEMLDVAIMGVIVVCLAGVAYRKEGITLLMMPGLFLLAAAEVIHYVAYYFVHGALYFADKEKQMGNQES
eukprot:TRINITY_DN12256_c0_g3_i1.p1 TRINITY_DN12256_c0_g3~~TRINITY_DN12256_c0_g3_i1.p1  ORF type:complete len:550 (+),score=62.81 TRINITY_DN12256_c0_g3_i1:54-1703(+)